jgi:hypothetical protein
LTQPRTTRRWKSGFFVFTHARVRPLTYRDPTRFDTIPSRLGRRTIASRALTVHQVAGRPDEELLLWRGKRTDLMEQGKAIRHAPVLNQLPVAKPANINYVD